MGFGEGMESGRSKEGTEALHTSPMPCPLHLLFRCSWVASFYDRRVMISKTPSWVLWATLANDQTWRVDHGNLTYSPSVRSTGDKLGYLICIAIWAVCATEYLCSKACNNSSSYHQNWVKLQDTQCWLENCLECRKKPKPHFGDPKCSVL
jgi:hypothetical protein